MRELTKTQDIVYKLGAILLVAGLALAGLRSVVSAVPYAIGAVMFCSMQMLMAYEGNSFIIRRLRRQQIIGLLFILASAALYVMEIFEWGPYQLRHNYWLLAMAVGCVLFVYSVFRISKELKS